MNDLLRLTKKSGGRLYVAGTNTPVKVRKYLKPIPLQRDDCHFPSLDELEQALLSSKYKGTNKVNAYFLDRLQFKAWMEVIGSICRIRLYSIEDPIEFIDRQLKFDFAE